MLNDFHVRRDESAVSRRARDVKIMGRRRGTVSSGATSVRARYPLAVGVAADEAFQQEVRLGIEDRRRFVVIIVAFSQPSGVSGCGKRRFAGSLPAGGIEYLGEGSALPASVEDLLRARINMRIDVRSVCAR